MRLQVIPEMLGGAGNRRIEWEIDDAVFQESAGKDFMLEAIDILKGVLAFEEISSSKSPLQYSHRKQSSLSTIHSRSQSSPLPTDQSLASTTMAQPKRARAPSDPFLDTPASMQTDHPPSHSFGNGVKLRGEGDGLSRPISTNFDEMTSRYENTYDDGDEEYLRVWTSPDLADPEYLQLLKTFPSFVSRRPLPRFPVSSNSRHADIEEGDDEGMEGKQIHFGTGSIWVSIKDRSAGWEGGWWTRFILWWRRTFC